jgi:hypothetical protein
MLSSVGLEFEGQPHSGLDDAKNIARIIIRLLNDKAFLRINEKIVIGTNHESVDESHAVRLRTVMPVNRKDGDVWFRKQKKLVNSTEL